jgi:hypothetical protein
MTRSYFLFVVLCLAIAGCGRSPAAEGEHQGEDEHEGESEHEGEITISNEAAERAGIRTARAERRALAGGTAIPAEVQFEPSSTAHVSPSFPAGSRRVAVRSGP